MFGLPSPQMAIATVHVPMTNVLEKQKNKLRTTVLAKQAACKNIKSFERFVPQFDPVLDRTPKWGIPTKYSLKTMFIATLTLQNMGLMQASLLGMFEDTAITTKCGAMIAFITFPVGYIIYVYVTLRGAMRPKDKTPKWLIPLNILQNYGIGPLGDVEYRTIAQDMLGSIPLNMREDDLVFKASIPPALSEPIHVAEPHIPEDSTPEEAREILEQVMYSLRWPACVAPFHQR